MHLQDDLDSAFMRAAVRLSTRHLGRTGSNPSVGALIVQKRQTGESVIIGQGVTAINGRPHAETQALQSAKQDVTGATVYVTLEPCAHFGKTQPCAQALIAHKIGRVVVACLDPDPRVCGKGIALLQKAGIEVYTGVEKAYAASILQGYFFHRIFKRPMVTLKMALADSGVIGARSGESLKISGALSLNRVHILRAQSDAILVGIGTVLKDDPLLTCRLPGLEQTSPVRVIIDPFLSIPLDCRLVQTCTPQLPVMLFTTSHKNQEKYQTLLQKGVKIFSMPSSCEHINPHFVLSKLAEQGINTLLIEGGAKTAQHFIKADLVDRLILFRNDKKFPQGDVFAPDFSKITQSYKHLESCLYGSDRYDEWSRSVNLCLPEL